MDIPRQRKRRFPPWLLAALGLTALAAGVFALSGLRDAAPAVDRTGLHIDTVRTGSMLREVRGPGTLVPERIRFVTALHAGRVEKIHVEPGTEVCADTVLLELSNSDIELAALQAEMDLKEANADFQSLKAQLESGELAQQAVIAEVKAKHRDAKQTEEDDEALYAKNHIAKIILTRSRNRTSDLAERLKIEQGRLTHHVQSKEAQIAAQTSRLDQLRAIKKFRDEQCAALEVRAATNGVCQELPLELGQWVVPGALLAKVVDPTALEAELEIAEIQAKDVGIGQKAVIDTRHGKVKGRVSRIDPSVRDGSVTVDVKLDGALPDGSRPDQSVDGTIELEHLEDILYVGRPVYGEPGETVGLFKLAPDGVHADRVSVKLGKSSVNTIQVIEGLQSGDQVILTDMSQWDDERRIRLRG